MREKVCLNCGTVAKPKLFTPGNIGIELVLWILFIVPGVIYSVWRHGSRRWVCRACNAFEIVPPTSPMAKKMLAQLSADETAAA